MATRSYDSLFSTCDEIEDLLRGAAPSPDDARRDRIRFLCTKLCVDSYTTEKANKLADAARAYFSSQKHALTRGGADGLLHAMRRSLLGAIREQLRWLEQSNG